MKQENKKKLFVIAGSFFGGVIITLLLVWLISSPCPCKKRMERMNAMHRPSIERQMDVQKHKRGSRRGPHRPTSMEDRPFPERQPSPAPEQAQ